MKNRTQNNIKPVPIKIRKFEATFGITKTSMMSLLFHLTKERCQEFHYPNL